MANTVEENNVKTRLINRIYYFSGTGNSYYVAKKIADRINAVLLPIVSLKKGDAVEADLLCFVFPVYDFKPPKQVTEIIDSLSSICAKYIIAIGTYGVALSSTLYHFKSTLNQKGIILSSGYGIRLPHNAVGSVGFSDEENQIRILEADKKISKIADSILAGTVGNVERSSIFNELTMIKQLPYIMKLLLILIFKGPKSLRFTVSHECINCYQCIRFCPVNNIELVNERLMFGNNCTSCFACLQWCPNSAIHIGKYSFKEINMRHYHHPKVKAVDLIFDSSKE